MAKLRADKLALPLLVKISQEPPKNRLPFALNRKLGTLDVTVVILPITPPPIDSAPKPPPNPFGQLVMGGLAVKTQTVKTIGIHYTDTTNTQSVAKNQIVKSQSTLDIQKDIDIHNIKFKNIDNHQSKNLTAKIIPQFNAKACQIRPTADRLAFALRRKSYKLQELSTNALPFALTCWHDLPPPQIPNKGAYIVHNTITATIGGLNIDLLNFSIKTDMDSFCWQGQIEISKKDYQKIKHKLDTKRGLEPLITVSINSHLFTIIAEDISKTRSFVNHTYTLSGRSVTAHLSQDYANVVKLDDLYASQIVSEALKDLPISADFGVNDWRGTPIGIIDSVAKACGGFVMSDKADARLFIRPRYKVPAWNIATTTPDRIIALDVIKSISEQKRTNVRYNAVILTSSKEGAIVYREHEGQNAHAPVSQNELYTDKACIIPTGIAFCRIVAHTKRQI